MPDDRKSLGEILHEARVAGGEARPRPWPPEAWADRDERLKALDEAMAAAVAKRAVADAFGARLPVILDALRIALASGGYEFQRKRYRVTLEALGGTETVVRGEKERSDEKGAGHG